MSGVGSNQKAAGSRGEGLGRALSVDLAYASVRNLGLCLISVRHGRLESVEFIPPEELFSEKPNAEGCALAIAQYCENTGISVVLLDGPQGWKDPESALNCRCCEKILNAQAKVGIEGQVKPVNFTKFVKFSVSLFTNLIQHGGVLVELPTITVPPTGFLLAESYPRSAWRKLGISPLPSKKKAKQEDLRVRLQSLERLFNFKADSDPTHDELCALVAGLAGTAILAGDTKGYIAEGDPPMKARGITVEGFIVNPRLDRKPA